MEKGLSGPDARAQLFAFVHEHGQVNFREVNEFVAAANPYFGGGVTAIDILRYSDQWYTVEVNMEERTVTALERMV